MGFQFTSIVDNSKNKIPFILPAPLQKLVDVFFFVRESSREMLAGSLRDFCGPTNSSQTCFCGNFRSIFREKILRAQKNNLQGVTNGVF